LDVKQKSIISTEKVEGGEGTLKFIASKEIIDRMGDVIVIDGINTANFEKNPVFLWMHDHTQPPIGKVVGIEKRVGLDGTKEMVIEVKFYDSARAMEFRRMYEEGFLNAVSVSISAAEYKSVRRENGVEGFDFLKSDLLEISGVTVPGNELALITRALETSLDSDLAMKKLSEKMKDLENIFAHVETIAKALEKFAGCEKSVLSPEITDRLSNIAKKMSGGKNA
jgi:hypothetical protein